VLKKFLISMKFILINLDNGFINQNSHVLVFSFSGVFILFTRKLNAKLLAEKDTMWGKTLKWLAYFSCLLLDSDSVSYWNICRIYSDFADKKSLMFIGKIVDRMDTYLPTSHLQSMKTPLKLNVMFNLSQSFFYYQICPL
jgi:hypothetical protein